MVDVIAHYTEELLAGRCHGDKDSAIRFLVRGYRK